MENNFIPFKKFVNEAETSEDRFGCVMLFANVPDWHRLVRRLVREEDIYLAPDDDYGYEDKPHITLLWGIHHDSIIDKGIIYNKIGEIPTLTFTVNEVGIFSNENSPYDVIKFDVKLTKKLVDLRKDFEEDLPNTQTFPDYHPHMTIAYVKKGTSEKYRRILKKGLKMKFTQGVYSDPDYRKVYIDLKNSKYKK